MPASVLHTPSPHRLAPGRSGRQALRTATDACHLLRRHGWHTSLADLEIVGETDVRLLAASTSRHVTIEVLCPCTADDEQPWAAVRIRTEDDRTIWRGPPQSCSTETLTRFIDDLARHPDALLKHRYDFCG